MSQPSRPAQTYANHVRKLPALYVGACVVVGLDLVWQLYRAYRSPGLDAAMSVLFALAVGALAYYVRVNSLTVQNRVVRLEERLRLERLLPEELRSRIPELTVDQLVALRFAADAEVSGLVRQVLDERLDSRDGIKRRIREWRADWLRV
jgi:hypothetical protein